MTKLGFKSRPSACRANVFQTLYRLANFLITENVCVCDLISEKLKVEDNKK